MKQKSNYGENAIIKQTAYNELIKIAEFIKKAGKMIENIENMNDQEYRFSDDESKLSEALKLNSEDIKKYSKILANK